MVDNGITGNGWKRAAVVLSVLVPLTGVAITGLIWSFKAGGKVESIRRAQNTLEKRVTRIDTQSVAMSAMANQSKTDSMLLKQKVERLQLDVTKIVDKMDAQHEVNSALLAELRKRNRDE